jgi:hypothetical protein
VRAGAAPPFAAGAIWHEVVLELVEPREGDKPVRTLASVLVPPAGARSG